jgi:hypothetical protein
MSQQMEVRLARLEGAYEQIDRRLVDLRQDLDRHFAAIDQRFAAIDQRFAGVDSRFGGIEQRFAAVDQKLTWIIGLIVATWTTTILTIVFHH